MNKERNREDGQGKKGRESLLIFCVFSNETGVDIWPQNNSDNEFRLSGDSYLVEYPQSGNNLYDG